MKKYAFILCAFAAALVSCNKENELTGTTGNEGGVPLNIIGSFGPQTKWIFTEQAEGGFNLQLQEDVDHLWVYFQKPDSSQPNGYSMVGSRAFLPVESVSDGGRTATFAKYYSVNGEEKRLTVPEEATKVFAYLDYNLTPITYNSSPTFCTLSEQDGTAESANLHHVIVGGAELEDLEGDGEALLAPIEFSYRTAVLKLELTFPRKYTPTADENTTITLVNENILNKVHVSWGDPGGSSTKGNIVTHPCSVNGTTATAYVTVWGEEYGPATVSGKEQDFSGTKIVVTMADYDDVQLIADFSPSKTIEPGKAYNVKRTLEPIEVKNIWVTDEAGSDSFSATRPKSNAPWLTYSNGRVNWEANTTGLPRVGTITSSDGGSYTITQISEEDFAGDWNIMASLFGGRGNYYARNASYSGTVTFGEPLSTETLSFNGEPIENNIGIRGLCANLVMDAHLNIDYDEHKVDLGFFCDGRKAQQLTTGALAGTYAAFLPEMEGARWGQYEFGRCMLGDPNYAWIWMTVTVENGALTAKLSPHVQKLQIPHDWTRDYVIGIEVMNFTSETISDETLVLGTNTANSATGHAAADWICIYQANYGTNDNSGLTLSK